MWWLHVVFQRYETTLALPIEYGTVNVGMVTAGVILLQEYRYMDAWQVQSAASRPCARTRPHTPPRAPGCVLCTGGGGFARAG